MLERAFQVAVITMMYIDDHLVVSRDFIYHKIDVTKSVTIVNGANLRLKIEKSHFAQRNGKFLGHITSFDVFIVNMKIISLDVRLKYNETRAGS